MEIKNTYIPNLDGLRGIACLLVVFSHLVALSSINLTSTEKIGSFGVLIFFSLSGFLMGHLYLFQKYSPKAVIRFSISRFSRIVPAYYIAILVYLFIDLFINNFYNMNVLNFIKSVFFLSSVGVFWSIGPEIQFYIYFVLFWLAIYLYSNGKRNLLVLILIITLIMIMTRNIWPGISLPSKLHVFLFGLVAAFLYPRIKNNFLFSSYFLGMLLLLIGVYLYFSIDQFNIFNNLLISLLTALLVLIITKKNKLNFILDTILFRFLGHASFSIYLFHGPVIRLFDYYIFKVKNVEYLVLTIIFFISILVPCAFYYYVEQKINSNVKNYLLKKYIN